jgi:hypothetical protein
MLAVDRRLGRMREHMTAIRERLKAPGPNYLMGCLSWQEWMMEWLLKGEIDAQECAFTLHAMMQRLHALQTVRTGWRPKRAKDRAKFERYLTACEWTPIFNKDTGWPKI